MTDKPIKATLDSSDDSVKTQKPILIQLDDIPTPTDADAGKVLGVDEDGAYALTEGSGGAAREISVGSSADAFAFSGSTLYALTDISFDTENEANTYIDREIERKVTTVFLNMAGAPAPYDELGAFTFILTAVCLINNDTPLSVVYSIDLSKLDLVGTLTGTFNAFEKSGKYYVACELVTSA